MQLLEHDQKIVLFTFGGDRERFQWDRLLMRGLRETQVPKTLKAEEALPGMPSMDTAQDDFVDEWSRLARRVHIAYKVFSAGCWTMAEKSVEKDLIELGERLQDKISYSKAIRENPDLLERLTWLEHRRWTAFMYTRA